MRGYALAHMTPDILLVAALYAGLVLLASLGACTISAIVRQLDRLHRAAWLVIPATFALVLVFTR